jgi:phosphocarrier protein NPr
MAEINYTQAGQACGRYSSGGVLRDKSMTGGVRMIEKTLTVVNEMGIHARPASQITRCCRKFICRTEAVAGGVRKDLKNVTNVMMLGSKRGEGIRVEFDGDDETSAAAELEALFAARFNEK